MNFLKRNILTISLMLLVGMCVIAPDAFAATVFDTANKKASETFKAVKTVIFIVGGFGLVALAFFAVFGKLKWTWFASLAVGLALLAAAGAIIDYATTNTGTGETSNFTSDTLTGTGGSSSF